VANQEWLPQVYRNMQPRDVQTYRHYTQIYITQSSANEYIKETASFIGRAKQQQQIYCNSFESVYDSETKTGQVQSKEYCNKDDLFIYNILNSLLKSVNYCV